MSLQAYDQGAQAGQSGYEQGAQGGCGLLLEPLTALLLTVCEQVHLGILQLAADIAGMMM